MHGSDSPRSYRGSKPISVQQESHHERQSHTRGALTPQHESVRQPFSSNPPLVEIKCCRTLQKSTAEGADDALDGYELPGGGGEG